MYFQRTILLFAFLLCSIPIAWCQGLQFGVQAYPLLTHGISNEVGSLPGEGMALGGYAFYPLNERLSLGVYGQYEYARINLNQHTYEETPFVQLPRGDRRRLKLGMHTVSLPIAARIQMRDVLRLEVAAGPSYQLGYDYQYTYMKPYRQQVTSREIGERSGLFRSFRRFNVPISVAVGKAFDIRSWSGVASLRYSINLLEAPHHYTFLDDIYFRISQFRVQTLSIVLEVHRTKV